MEFPNSDMDTSAIVADIVRRFRAMQVARRTARVDERLSDCHYRRVGQYSSTKMERLRERGQPTTYVKLTSIKARAVAAFLESIYLDSRRPWSLDPTPIPELPEDAGKNVAELVAAEVKTKLALGEQVDEADIEERIREVVRMTQEGLIKKARDESEIVRLRLDDILLEGGFYNALEEFITDFVTYPFAVLKGPLVRTKPKLRWMPDAPEPTVDVAMKQILTWERVDPRFIWWTPGATSPHRADFVQKLIYDAATIDEFRNVEGFDGHAIDMVLEDYGERGFSFDSAAGDAYTSAEELAADNNSANVQRPKIEVLEFNGRVLGTLLEDYAEQIPSFDRSAVYYVRAWVCGRYLLKLNVDRNKLARPPYYIAQFSRLPGSMIGLALPELLADIQDSVNATFRALIRNIAIASGPQVVIDVDRMVNPSDSDLEPWKKWQTSSTGQLSSGRPVDFFQPSLNAGELIPLLQLFMTIADEVSAVPRFLMGSGRIGGAGRTASGLSMLTENAMRVLQSTARTIDGNVLGPAIEYLYQIVLTKEPGSFRGDLQVKVHGATFAKQREADRRRVLELLNLTSNPVDLQIMGARGRATLLRHLIEDLGLEGEFVLPSDKQIVDEMMANQMRPGPAPSGDAGNNGSGETGGNPDGVNQ